MNDPLCPGTILFIAALEVSSAQVTAQLVATEQDNGKTLTAVAGQTFEVKLKGNATTGYSWSLLNTNGTSVWVTGPWSYIPDSPGVVGSGGSFMLPFLAVKTGITTLSFEYARPSDPQNPAQTYSVSLNVVGAPRLTIQLLGHTNVVITWSIADSNGFYLEGSRTIDSGWAALNALPIPTGTNYAVSLGIAGDPLFFRLRN